METYIETQKFNQWYIKLILIIPFITVISGIIMGDPKSSDSTHLAISFGILGIITALFYFTKLETKLDEDGVKVRFYPFQRAFYFVAWDELEEFSIRKYKPLLEYGGWGFRYSFRRGKAFNVSGNMGLQLVLKSGKKFLIGTNKPEEMQAFLDQIKSRRTRSPNY